ncbi:5798_t:CDS:2 [Scutellospora calospora]|uniref:5798_t:CDS:1 n=1 Tax=Scutellospora calospora TaxID=85575 RepID=A0ACA9JZV6_9GLOM|nr:5798_t:CDS:2 [Scutellospora calospora]
MNTKVAQKYVRHQETIEPDEFEALLTKLIEVEDENNRQI